jgi:hypothetical protein
MPVERKSRDQSCELLRSVVRINRRTAEGGVSRLAAGVKDWDTLLELAADHGVLPFLFRALAQEASVPPDAARRLLALHHGNIARCMTNAVELTWILKRLEDQSIPAMPFKGMVLAASAYGDSSARPAGDIDLLVYRRDLKAASRLLAQRGFELLTETEQDGSPTDPNKFEHHFERPADGLVVELRWRLEMIQPRFKRDLGMDWVWPQRQTATVAGATIPNMKPEIALPVLCMHGCQHVWSRLLWICDIAKLLESNPSFNWAATMREAKRNGLLKPLALGVMLASRVAAAPVPEAVLRRFEADSCLAATARHIDENLFIAPGSVPPSRLPYNIQLLSFTDRARLLLSRDFLQPSPRDLEMMPLPKALHVLYPLVKPIRMLFDRSPRF